MTTHKPPGEQVKKVIPGQLLLEAMSISPKDAKVYLKKRKFKGVKEPVEEPKVDKKIQQFHDELAEELKK